MEVKVVLTFVLLAGLWVADGCSGNRKECNDCKDKDRRSIVDKIQVGSSEKDDAPYSIKLRGNPCNFSSYDVDGNGEITKEELQALFRITEETQTLFLDIDITPEDGVIKPEEFYSKAPLIIAECSHSDRSTDDKAE